MSASVRGSSQDPVTKVHVKQAGRGVGGVAGWVGAGVLTRFARETADFLAPCSLGKTLFVGTGGDALCQRGKMVLRVWKSVTSGSLRRVRLVTVPTALASVLPPPVPMHPL